MCTCFRIKSTDSAVIVGRTMEFGADLGSKVTIFPKNMKYEAVGPNNSRGLSWEGKYGIVGLNGFGQDVVTDGINEAGLYFGALYLPGFSKYQEVPSGKESESMTQMYDIGKYILSTCATIEDVKAAVEKVLVWGAILPGMTEIMGLHFAIHDQNGNSCVIEYPDGTLHIHDNPLGVLTNSPTFDWHLLNIRNFVNLTANNIPDLDLKGDTVKAIGQGSGMIGLPGDFTPPSRFVRAVALTQSALPTDTAEKGAILAFHILDSFDITLGLVRGKEGDKETYENTQWSSVADLKNKYYFVRYYNNPAVLRVDLSKINFGSDKVTHLNSSNIPWFTDISNTQN